ncbi:MAG TPA: DUF5718 family protein [Miltoncostaeaceae bacterium]|nr:DUF5718 family protein [Miltoncostaeaceae bacterium]
MIRPSPAQLKKLFGFGVAGNFAGHLEQAGEAADFVNVAGNGAEAPKGIFPWFVPGEDGFLGTFPVADDHLALPASDEPLNLQIEPEAGVIFRVAYDEDGRPRALHPEALGAFNDCSIRRPGATRISQKKNWGPASKGLAPRLFPLDDLDPDGPSATWRLACFLRRDGRAMPYGIDSPLPGYSYYGQTLTDWIVERLHNQRAGEDTPLEDVGALLRAAGSPERLLVGIGATRYTEVGESTYLRPGDEALVIVYDARATSPERLVELVEAGREDEIAHASVLRQRVLEAGALA